MTARREDVFKMVRDAERRAEERIAEARKRADEIRSAGVKEGIKITESAEQEAARIYKSMIDEKRVQLEAKRKGMMSKGEEEARRIRTQGASNLPKAVEALISKLESEG
jgi:V/A-type H+-transporting ATPase subunit G/H